MRHRNRRAQTGLKVRDAAAAFSILAAAFFIPAPAGAWDAEAGGLSARCLRGPTEEAASFSGEGPGGAILAFFEGGGLEIPTTKEGVAALLESAPGGCRVDPDAAAAFVLPVLAGGAGKDGRRLLRGISFRGLRMADGSIGSLVLPEILSDGPAAMELVSGMRPAEGASPPSARLVGAFSVRHEIGHVVLPPAGLSKQAFAGGDRDGRPMNERRFDEALADSWAAAEMLSDPSFDRMEIRTLVAAVADARLLAAAALDPEDRRRGASHMTTFALDALLASDDGQALRTAAGAAVSAARLSASAGDVPWSSVSKCLAEPEKGAPSSPESAAARISWAARGPRCDPKIGRRILLALERFGYGGSR